MVDSMLILVRHAATRANVSEPYVLQGLRPDSALVPEGRRQARAVAEVLRHCSAVKAYCSPLKRALQTARPIARSLGVSLEVEDALLEADTGRWTGLSWPEIRERWPDECKAFEKDAERHGYLGGESLAQVRDRILPAMEGLVARHTGQALVVVGHGVANRVLLAHWLGLPLRYARQIPQDNGAFSVVEFRAAVGRVRTINTLAPSPLAA